MAKVIGIGGVFLEFKGDKETLYQWYEENLGLDFTDYGSGFITGKQLMLWSFKRSDEHFPLINLRVDHLDDLAKHLKNINIQFTLDVTEYPYGKFANFIDPFGNVIELWEVYEDAYIAMVQEEINQYKKNRKKIK